MEKTLMRKITMGLFLGAALMSSMAMATDIKDILLSATEIQLKLLERVKTAIPSDVVVEPLQDYDYDKNVPPSFDVLTSQVGKKEQLNVFLPTKSVKYIKYFMIDHPDATAFRAKYYHGYGNSKSVIESKMPADPKEGFIDPSTINKMTFFKNGILMNIDVAKSPHTIFDVEDLTSDYSVEYEYGKGYVLKADLITDVKINNESDNEKVKYVFDEYKKALSKKDYGYESIWGYINNGSVYEKNDSIVEVSIYEMSFHASIALGYRYNNATMSFYTQETYNNYEKMLDDFKQDEYRQEYQKLDHILNK